MTKEKKTHVKRGREILISVETSEKRVVILQDGKMVDFFMERESSGQYAGSIYKGRVNTIIQGIEAAFVDIGLEKNGFLHVSDVLDKSSILKNILPDEDEPTIRTPKGKKNPRIGDILKPKQEILVQVVKEAMSTKGARVTTFISIPGRYLVLTPFDSGVGISRRISDRVERQRIKDIFKKIELPDKMGCIVRTVAEGRTEKELRNEANYLLNLWTRIKARAEKQSAPIKVYEEYGIVLRMIRDKFTEEVSQLLVDSKEEHARVTKFLKAFMPSLRKNVKLYKGRTPLFQKYNLEKKIDELFERKVALKSGGSLVIEQTESLVAIDVNTGSFTGKRNLEETAFKTNLEAAEEVARQLMLRDVGGIIIIDFIDMEEKAHRDKVFTRLQEKLKDDKARINLRAISAFGVVEMTRQRMHKSIESTSHVECPYCAGKGVIKSAETVAIETVRKIDKVLSSERTKHKHISVLIHPDINNALLSDQANMLSDIQRKYRCKIDLREDNSLHFEDVIIEERIV